MLYSKHPFAVKQSEGLDLHILEAFGFVFLLVVGNQTVGTVDACITIHAS